MSLGKIISAYREEHDLSLREFARNCGLSHGYIIRLEKEFEPKTGYPIDPALGTLESLANGMGMALEDLLEQLVDVVSIVDLNTEQKESVKNMVRLLMKQSE
jgi:transcriptional regulator with XRE-family HTH domain